MTELEGRLYLALLGARPIVSAQAKLNPGVIRVSMLVDKVLDEYKSAQAKEPQDAFGE